MLATRYAIIAESAHVERARSVLGVDAPGPAPWRPPATTPAAEPPSRPMSYGEATDAARRAAAAEAAGAAGTAARERPRYGEYAPVEDADASQSIDAAASGRPASDADAATPPSER